MFVIYFFYLQLFAPVFMKSVYDCKCLDSNQRFKGYNVWYQDTLGYSTSLLEMNTYILLPGRSNCLPDTFVLVQIHPW